MKSKFKIIFTFIFATIIFLNLIPNSFAASVSVNAESAIITEVSTGRIIYEKNSTAKMYPASTTKVMTAILTIENTSPQDIVTVSASALSNIPEGYVTCGLVTGEELTVNDLLHALMLPSANDAAYVLAEHIGGSVDGFSDLMNRKARELGCMNTHFVNPNGIHDNNHYSTAYDLYLIANYAMKNETFRNLVATKEYTLPATNIYPNNDRVLVTTNDLLKESSKNYYKYAIGIKTGYTSKAGDCLISEASRDGLEFISVVLNGDRFEDTKKLYNYAYDNYTLTKLTEAGSILDTIEIEKATKETKTLDVAIDKSITVIINKDIDLNSVIPEITYNENLEAPIPANTVIGTIKYKVDDIEYSANLLAKQDVIKQNYSIYIFITGISLLLVATIMMKLSKPKKYTKKRISK